MPITTTGSIVYFKDDLGQPLIGGKVYTYEYSTSKPKDIYKTAVRELPHTNPIILNDSGSVEWYLKGDYTIRVYTSEDVFVEEFDIVTPSKVQVDEVSDSLNFLKSELKNAAYRDTGTASAQVPLNSDLGTAAYKDVGAEAGNVMEVGAFGLGGSARVVITDTSMADHLEKTLGKSELVYSVVPSATGGKPFGDFSLGLSVGAVGDHVLIGFDLSGKKAGYIAKSGSNAPTNVSFWTDKNTPTSNLPVASIQAGIGAPKIAYKTLTGTLSSSTITSIPHGLDASKILSTDVVIFANNGNYVEGFSYRAYENFRKHFTAQDIVIRPFESSVSNSDIIGRPIKILITYSV